MSPFYPVPTMGEGWVTWLDNHPLVLLYLVGCVFVFLLAPVKLGVFWLLSWITKAHILRKNLKKVAPPDSSTFLDRLGIAICLLFVVAAFSWLGVLYAIWEIAALVFGVLREALVSTPEAIKALRFPLRNNPTMPRESVWAHVQALQIKMGEKQPTETTLLAGLNELKSYYPSFQRDVALKQLAALRVLPREVISAAMAGAEKPPPEDTDSWDDS